MIFGGVRMRYRVWVRLAGEGETSSGSYSHAPDRLSALNLAFGLGYLDEMTPEAEASLRS